MRRRTSAGPVRHLTVCASAVGLALALGLSQSGAAQQRGEPGEGTRGQGGGPAGRGRANYSLNDPAPNDPALKGAIDMHAHQDPDSFGPSYGQAARSIDALDLYTRAKASGMRGFIIKGHLDQTAGLAYYMRKLHPDMEIFGGMGSNLTTGTKVNPWAITHMAEMKGGWGRIVWMPSWDSENSIHKLPRRPPAYVAVAECKGLPFWINYPKPCPDGGELLPEVKEAIADHRQDEDARQQRRPDPGDRPQLAARSEADGEGSRPRGREAHHHHAPAARHRGHDAGGDQGDRRDGPRDLRGVHLAVRQPERAARGREAVRRGHPRAGVEHAFVSSDTGQLNSNWQPDALANCAKVAARERVHRARARPAAQDQPGEDSRDPAACWN